MIKRKHQAEPDADDEQAVVGKAVETGKAEDTQFRFFLDHGIRLKKSKIKTPSAKKFFPGLLPFCRLNFFWNLESCRLEF
jgi:hypothetical protein